MNNEQTVANHTAKPGFSTRSLHQQSLLSLSKSLGDDPDWMRLAQFGKINSERFTGFHYAKKFVKKQFGCSQTPMK